MNTIASMFKKLLKLMKKILIKIFQILEIILIPFTIISSIWMKMIRHVGLHRLYVSNNIFKMVGVLPLRDHYYEPLINPKYLNYSLRKDRPLVGIDLNINSQLNLLKDFKYNDELLSFPIDR